MASIPEAQAAVAYRSSSPVVSANSGPFDVAMPAGTVQNDIMIMVVTTIDNNDTVTVPAGWTKFIETNNTTALRATVAWKRAGAGEVGPYSIDTTGSGNAMIAAISSFSGVVTTGSPIDVSNSQANASSTTVTAPAVTPTVVDTMIVFTVHLAAQGTISGYSGTNPTFTEAFDGNSNKGATGETVSLAYGLKNDTTSTGSRTATATVAGLNVGGLFALLPAAGGDVTPPAAIADLTVTGTTSNAADLAWTAPGDDGAAGTAASYDVRYSTTCPLVEAGWAAATQAAGEPAPKAAGQAESFTVTGLSPSTAYCFAIKTSDEVPNVSTISNSAPGTTTSGTVPGDQHNTAFGLDKAIGTQATNPAPNLTFTTHLGGSGSNDVPLWILPGVTNAESSFRPRFIWEVNLTSMKVGSQYSVRYAPCTTPGSLRRFEGQTPSGCTNPATWDTSDITKFTGTVGAQGSASVWRFWNSTILTNGQDLLYYPIVGDHAASGAGGDTTMMVEGTAVNNYATSAAGISSRATNRYSIEYNGSQPAGSAFDVYKLHQAEDGTTVNQANMANHEVTGAEVFVLGTDYATVFKAWPGGADHSGTWTNPTNITASDDLYASTAAAGNHVFGTWGLGIPAGAVIDIVTVGAEWKGTVSNQAAANVSVSWDGGTTWSPAPHQIDRALNLPDRLLDLNILDGADVTADTAWTVAKLNDANFRVRLEWANGTASVDRLVVEVLYHCTGGCATTTIGNGTNPGNASLAPGGAITDLNSFTLQTNSGTDSITALTVTLAAGTAAGLSEVRITSDNGATTYFSAVANPGSDTVNFSGGTPIPVTTTAAQFKVRITPKTHANMPAPPGSSYAVTGTVTAFTSTNPQAGTDTNSATVTVDNLSPGNVTGSTATDGDAQVSLSWTNPGDGDLNSLVVLRRATTAVADVPVEGTTYTVGNTIGTSTVACVTAAPGTSCTDTGLTNGTAYHYKIFSKDTNGNYSAGVVPAGSPATPAPDTTTIGDGTNPGNVTLAPGAAITDLDAFTFQTNRGADSITALTVTLAAGTAASLSEIRITSDNGATTYFTAVSNPGSDTVNFSGGTPIPVTTAAAQFKVRITPKIHAIMPAPPGASYAVTGTVTAFTSTNTQAGTDAGSATVTVDNLSPGNVTGSTAGAGDTQVSLAWTNPGDADLASFVVLRNTVAVTDTPTEGAPYLVGNTIGTSTVACVTAVPGTSCTDTGLTNGTAYHYKIFAKDANGNYSTGVVPTGSPATPAATTTIADGTNPANVTLAPGAAITDLDSFTFQASTGTDSVTALTVTLAAGTAAGLSEVRITSDNGLTTYFTAVANPATDTVNFSGGTPIPVTTTATQFKVRITPKSHAALPAPPGSSYAVTGTVTGWTGTNVNHAGADTGSATVTVDNLSPGNVAGGLTSAGDGQVSLSWFDPGDADLASVVVLRRAAVAVGDVPVEGQTYLVGDPIGSSVAACVVAAGAMACTDTGLTNGTAYHYKIFARDSRGNYSTGAVPGLSPATPNPTTTLGNGTNPASATIAPGASATMLDAFTFQTTSGTDTITALTVQLAAGTSGGLSLVEITNDAGAVVHGSASNPATDTPAISLTTNITATTTLTQYKIRITPKTHANMPAPPGSSYAVTARITAWTGTNANKTGSDFTSATVTVDNLSPGNVTGSNATAGDTQVSLSWTNPADLDLSGIVVLRGTSAVAATPVEGQAYSVGDPIGSATVACVVVAPTAACTSTGLTNGTAYHYKIFAKDTNGNYSTGVVPSGSPATPVKITTIGDGTAPSDKTVTPGSANNAVSAFTLITSSGTDTVTALTVTFSGTSAADVVAGGVKIYRDNGSVPGEWDATDTSIAAQSFTAGAAAFTGLSLPVNTVTAQYLITYDIDAAAMVSNTLQGAITAGAAGGTVVNNDTVDAVLTVGSAVPPPAAGDGRLVYAKTASGTLFTRPWSAGAWGAEATAIVEETGIQWTVTKSSPLRNEFISVQLINIAGGSALVASRYSGVTGAWTVDWCIRTGGGSYAGTACANATTIANANVDKRGFDLEYETSTGNAIVLYSRNVTGTNEMAYRKWNGSSWSAETLVDTARLTGTVTWIELASKPGGTSNEVTALFSDTNSDLSALVWNGAAWGTEPAAALETALPSTTLKNFDGEYESSSGDFLGVWGFTTVGFRYATRPSSGAWSSVTTNNSGPNEIAANLDLAADPLTNYMVMASNDPASSDNQCNFWNGAAWATLANCDTGAGNALAGYQVIGGGWVSDTAAGTKRGIIVYAAAASANLNWYWIDPNAGTPTWTAGGVFVIAGAVSAVTSPIQVAMNPFNPAELLALVGKSSGLHGLKLTLSNTTLTWTNPSGAALVTLPTTSTFMPYHFDSNRFIPQTVSCPTSPATVELGAQNVSVTVSGANFLQGSSVSFSGTGLAVSSTVFNSAASLTATVSVSGSAATGARSAVVTNAAGVAATGPACLTVVDLPAPTGLVFETDPAINPLPWQQVFMYWTDNSISETGFTLERALSDGSCNGTGETYSPANPSTIVPYPGNPVTWYSLLNPGATGGTVPSGDTDTQLAPSTAYCYRVKANNALRSSAWLYSAPVTTAAAPPDVTAPGNVTDLAVMPGGQNRDYITLNWTAPGDDGTTGRAASYILRYSMRPMVDGGPGAGQVDWNDTTCADPANPVDCAVTVVNLAPPLPVFSTETRMVTGRINPAATPANSCDTNDTSTAHAACVISNTVYFFALKTRDEAGNTSTLLSNLAGGDDFTDGSLAGRTSLRPNFNLVSVPRLPVAPSETPAAVFGDDTGATLYRWTSTGLTPLNGCYKASPSTDSDCSPALDIATVKPGEGYFLAGGGNRPVIDLPSSAVAVATSTICGLTNSYAVTLQIGWNLIGNPFDTGNAVLNDANAAVRQNGTTCFTLSAAAAANLVGSAAYSYNGSSYDVTTTLEPWKGYWFQVVNNNVFPSGNTFELILKRP